MIVGLSFSLFLLSSFFFLSSFSLLSLFFLSSSGSRMTLPLYLSTQNLVEGDLSDYIKCLPLSRPSLQDKDVHDEQGSALTPTHQIRNISSGSFFLATNRIPRRGQVGLFRRISNCIIHLFMQTNSASFVMSIDT